MSTLTSPVMWHNAAEMFQLEYFKLTGVMVDYNDAITLINDGYTAKKFYNKNKAYSKYLSDNKLEHSEDSYLSFMNSYAS